MQFKLFVEPRYISLPLCIMTLFLVLTLTGCAINTQNSKDPSTTPASSSVSEQDENETVTTKSHSQTDVSSPGTPGALPAQELTSDLLYDLMLAELALQRNDYSLAFEKYYQAAQQTRDSRLAKKATRVTLFSKNDEQTFKSVKLWSELQPDNVDVQQIYASSLISQKQDEQAVIYLKRVINLSDDFDEGFKRAITILDPIDDRSRATRIFSQISEQHANEPIVLLYRAKLEMKHKDYASAEKYLNEVLTAKPDYMDALVLKVDLLKKQKRHLQAIQTLQSILKKLPENTALRLELARMMVENNFYDQAFQQIKILAKKDLEPEVLFAIGLLAIEMDKLDDARQYLERLHAHRLYASEAAYFIGQLEAGRGNYTEAEDWFKRVRHGKYVFEAYLGLAVVYSQQKKFDQAFKLLDSSKATTDKENIEVLQIKAEVYAQAKNYTKAYEIYSEALSLSPKNHDLRYGRAMLAEKFGRIDLLEKDLHIIIAANPKDNQALNALGYTLADRTERYEEAFQYIERAMKINPDDVATLDSMGWVLYKLGKPQEALKYLQKAYGKDQDPEIAAHYGEVLWVLGQTQEARSIWKKALKVDPEHRVLVGTTSRYLK